RSVTTRRILFSDYDYSGASDSAAFDLCRSREDNASTRVSSRLRVLTTQQEARRSLPVRQAATALHHHRSPESTRVRRTIRRRSRPRRRDNRCSKACDPGAHDRASQQEHAKESAGFWGRTDPPSCFPTTNLNAKRCRCTICGDDLTTLSG